METQQAGLNLNLQLPPVIDDESLRSVAEVLKLWNSKWTGLLAERMYPQSAKEKKADPINKRGKQRVYSISIGIIKDNAVRLEFMVKGTELISELKEMYNKGIKAVRETAEQL